MDGPTWLQAWSGFMAWSFEPFTGLPLKDGPKPKAFDPAEFLFEVNYLREVVRETAQSQLAELSPLAAVTETGDRGFSLQSQTDDRGWVSLACFRQTLESSFSAVSTPIFASKYAYLKHFFEIHKISFAYAIIDF